MPTRFDRQHTDEFIEYVAASVTPFHAVDEAAALLRAAGFTPLSETEPWNDEPGGHYVIRAGSIIAWYVPENFASADGFNIIGAHTDSPTLRVKPAPDAGSAGWRQIAVEVYGGAPHDTWLDRDLGISGRLTTRDGETHLVSVNEPLLRVPRLAIHLDRRVNEGQVLDAQTHLTPIWGLGESADGELIEYLAERAELPSAEVIGWDLAVHDVQAPAYLGKDAELLASARLDNLVSVHAGLAALKASAADTRRIAVLAAFDHEECGSSSYSGAASPFLDTVLRRILEARSASFDEMSRAFAASFVMSSDTGHAVHPNYPERHDPTHWPVAGGGPIVKENVNQSYATDGAGRAEFISACERADVPWQSYVQRNSIPCGSTIGPITAARLGVKTADIGIAILSMHASRELCAADDPFYLAAALTAFLCR